MFNYSFGNAGVARFVFSVMATIFCALSLSSVVRAQSTYGTILGTVKDPSGSAVPKAAVELLNTGTNASRKTTTSETGAYQFVNVDTGTYQVKVTAPGFETVEFTAIDMSARDTKRFDADLKVASQA